MNDFMELKELNDIDRDREMCELGGMELHINLTRKPKEQNKFILFLKKLFGRK